MSDHRRLWTGDWEHDSALRAAELAERRRRLAEQPEQAPSLQEPLPADRRSPLTVASALVAALFNAAIGAVRLVGLGVLRLISLLRRANARVAAVAALAAALIVGV